MSDTIQEMGDNPNLYAVASDPSLPSTWKYPLFDAQQVDAAIEAVTMGTSRYDAKLTDEQKKTALDRIMARIPALNIEDWAKNSLMNTVKWRMEDMQNSMMVAKELETIEETSFGISTVSEFSDTYPEVPTAPDVDLQKLQDGDPDPMVITLPIAEIGKVSVNNIIYDRPLVESIAKQINDKKVGGIFGHIKDEERSTSFPIPKALWIGAKLEGNRLFAKAYVMQGEEREYLRKVSAVNGKIGTSIYGKGKHIPTNGKYKLANFNLEQVDFAPADRASLKLDAGFKITSELESDNKDLTMSLDVTTLRVDDAKNLPADVKAAIIAEFQAASKENDRVAELEFDITQKDQTIAELEKTVSEFKHREFSTALDKLVAGTLDWNTPDEDSKAKLEGLRKTLRSLTVAELAGEIDTKKAERAIKTVWDREFGVIAESVKDAITGGAAVTSGEKPKDWRDKFIEDAAKIRKEVGV